MIVTSLPEGRLLDFNDGFCHWTGYSREEAIGRTTQELQLWGKQEARDGMLQAVASQGRIRELETTLRHKSGEVRLCALSAEVVTIGQQQCLVSVVRDISARHEAREDLRVSEEKFSKAFRASPDAILISSVTDGKIADLNEGFSRISGWSREEVLGRTAFDIDLWVDPQARDRMIEALRRDGRVRERRCDFHMKSGEVRNFLIWVEIIEIARVPHLLTVAHDITEQQRAESEREAFVQELEAKNAELERFTYTVSHDLKSPLVTIRAFLGLLERDLERQDRNAMGKDIERIKAATDTMLRLLEELLDLARVGHLAEPPEEIALTDVAQEAVEQLAGQIAESGAIVEIAPDLPTATCERTRVLEVFQNLIDNAIKFRSDLSPKVEVGARNDEGQTVLFVHDNGIGIAEPYREKIFGLFERLDTGIEGTGVGLALVKRIVEVHGGRIWVESEGEGRGSTFCFTLGEPQSAEAADG